MLLLNEQYFVTLLCVLKLHNNNSRLANESVPQVDTELSVCTAQQNTS